MEETHKKSSQAQKNPTKLHTNFLYKAAIASIFLLILPILPSQAPEFPSQNRKWELIQLLFVGIAVSYGLLSRKHEEVEKENGAKFDSVNTYLSRFLQVSSVFDEEIDSKVQTWSNQCYREEPVVVVAQKKSSVLEEQSKIKKSSVFNEKPLLLPVRSLKTQHNRFEKIDSFSRSNSNLSSNHLGSNRFCSDSKKTENFENGEFEDFSENIDRTQKRVEKSGSFNRSNSNLSSNNLGSKRFSSDSEKIENFENDEFDDFSENIDKTQKIFENIGSFTRSYSNLGSNNSGSKHFSRNSKKIENIENDEYEDFYENIDRTQKRVEKIGSFTRSNSNWGSNNSGSKRFSSDSKKIENFESDEFEDFKEIKSDENIVLRSPIPWRSRSGKMENRENRENIESIPLFSLSSETEESVPNKFSQKSKTPPPAPPPPPPPPRRHHQKSPLGKPVSICRREIEEFDEFERDEEEETKEKEENVDKKADEFIAKFREQIRLQRIESIKRTTGQVGRSSPRYWGCSIWL